VAFKINIQSQITQNILSAYLGPEAGKQVLKGNIQRGDGETIHAVIWYSDMRESTSLANAVTGKKFLQALNVYFESTAGAVLSHGGEVLRFIGDAVLAIFPIRDEGATQKACECAIKAAILARENLVQANVTRKEKGLIELDYGLGLHIGQVLFGNIGIPERVEFSVIGSAANEVARIESLTKELKENILVSSDFAKHLSLDWVDAGDHNLRGVDRTLTLYTPPKSD
jgi:adenylate cyclase